MKIKSIEKLTHGTKEEYKVTFLVSIDNEFWQLVGYVNSRCDHFEFAKNQGEFLERELGKVLMPLVKNQTKEDKS